LTGLRLVNRALPRGRRGIAVRRLLGAARAGFLRRVVLGAWLVLIAHSSAG
jgi:hypothetical protein